MSIIIVFIIMYTYIYIYHSTVYMFFACYGKKSYYYVTSVERKFEPQRHTQLTRTFLVTEIFFSLRNVPGVLKRQQKIIFFGGGEAKNF